VPAESPPSWKLCRNRVCLLLPALTVLIYKGEAFPATAPLFVIATHTAATGNNGTELTSATIANFVNGYFLVSFPLHPRIKKPTTREMTSIRLKSPKTSAPSEASPTPRTTGVAATVAPRKGTRARCRSSARLPPTDRTRCRQSLRCLRYRARAELGLIHLCAT
jgi:hypothetical protein